MSHGSEGAVRAPRILVVDDSASARAITRATLGGVCAGIEEAGDGFAAFQHLLNASFDVVVTDLNMAPVDGRQLVLAMQLLPVERRPRVIICTASWDAMDERSRLAMRAADLVLRKPVDGPALLLAVTTFMADRSTMPINEA